MTFKLYVNEHTFTILYVSKISETIFGVLDVTIKT